MLRRYFSNSFRSLNKNDHLELVCSRLLKHECFKPLINELPPKYGQLDPYELSRVINEAVTKYPLKSEQLIPIHNKMIEELSKYEYGVSTVHAKRLEQIGGQLSKKATIEIIRNNPSRVNDSWELIQKFPKNLWTEALVLAAVENILSRNVYEENGKEILPLNSLAQCIVLLQRIDQKQNVKGKVWDTLVDHVLERKASGELQNLLQYGVTSLEPFTKRIDDLTPYQIYQLYVSFPVNLLKTEEGLFFKILNTLGRLDRVFISEKELHETKELSKYVREFSGSSNVTNLSFSKDLSQDYLHLKKYIHKNELDQKNLKLAKNLLRIEGVYKNNLAQSLELYHSYLLSYENRADELMFEIFLSFAYRGYKDSNPELLQYSQVLLQSGKSTSSTVDILRILMLANSRFDVEKSLELYNDDIEAFAKGEQESVTSDLLTESLIMSYLGNQDLDFARVIFEGAIRERILKNTSIIKRVKALFKTYGEAVEQGNVQVVMQEKILEVFETI